MKFNHLSDGEFEEFVYDLLTDMDFVNLSWRRGTGRDAPTPDQGRDIEAHLRRQEVDGSEHLETWFVQCKHYERGVSPEPLQGAVAWATAGRPSVLLFVVSGFLSNPSKLWLDQYRQGTQPPFRIKLWERKDLERFVASRPALAGKYGLEVETGTQSMHPAHLAYIRNPSINSLDHFFATLDKIDSRQREDMFDIAFFQIINPRFRKPKTGNEKIGELRIDEVSYEAFRARCYELSSYRLPGLFMVRAIVAEALGLAWKFGDPSEVGPTIARHQDAIDHFSKRLDAERDQAEREILRGIIAKAQEWVKSVPQKQKTWAEHYRVLCETILPALAMEEIRLDSSDLLGRA
jgi:hypothetical protein